MNTFALSHFKDRNDVRVIVKFCLELRTVGNGTDVYVTFINCKAIKDHCTYATKYHTNVLSVTIYEDQRCLFESSAKSTDRFTHTYFQNYVREWNQLDQSIIVSQPSKCLKFYTFREGCFVISN